ncbi:MAG: helix-turn-helix transcriptional regulator [Geminicoccaceae bacterium]
MTEASDRGLLPLQCRAARAMLRWSQEQLAQHASVARATIRDFENGRHRLHRSTETLIVAALTAAGVTLLGDPDIGLGVFWRPGGDDDGV